MTAQLSVADGALARLLNVSGSQTDFVLASADGSTTVRVGLAVSSVPDAELVLGSAGVVLDWARSTIMRGANCVSLTRMELRLLVVLMDSAPAPATREHLIARLWPSESSRAQELDAALPVWICALRRRFAAIGLPHAIRTVRSTGYGLCL
ncbi:MAG: winged helix-turn-helix domain-containing protein [Gemmatimonadaceae bacterium]